MNNYIKALFVFLFFIGMIVFAAESHAQPPKADTSVYKAEINGQDKQVFMNFMNDARVTLVKSSNSNTLEQNLQIVKNLESAINFLNEKFIAVKPKEDKKTEGANVVKPNK